jgi:flagellar hook-associated protein 1 FlgK
MSNLIKYQHSYTAAAKLITTAEQMMNTLLSMKQ